MSVQVRPEGPNFMLDLNVSNRVYLRPDTLSISLIGDLKAEFEHKNPVYYKMKSQGYWPTKAEPKVIQTWNECEDGSLSFPRGGLSRICKILSAYGEPYEVRESCNSAKAEFPLPQIMPYEYQQRCIDAAIANRIGIIKAPTGGGKTILGVALASQLDVPFMIVVNSAALLTQWEERIAQVFGEDYEVGRIQGRHFKLKPLTIAMAQTLHKLSPDRWADINKYFGGVIQDEVQVAAASTFMGSIDKCEAEYRIGLSADHTRKDRKEFLIHDTFGDVIDEISRDDLIAKSFVLDVHVILTPTELDAEWYRQQRFANDLRLGGAEFEDIYLAMKKQWPDMKMEDVPKERPDFNRLLDTMCADPVRNAKLLGLATELVNDGRRIFVFSHRVDHCLALVRDLGERGIRAGALIGGPENKEEFQRTIDGLQNGDYQVGVGTWQALGTGIDCSRVSGGIMATPINGKQIWGQIRGRLCRTHPGKKDAVLYYMWDRKVFFNAPVKNMKAWNTECSVDYNDTRMSVKEYLRMG